MIIDVTTLEKRNQILYKRLRELEEQLEEQQKKLKIKLPLVARIFPELVSNDLVGVQPMFTPVGLAYALRYRYQTASDEIDNK